MISFLSFLILLLFVHIKADEPVEPNSDSLNIVADEENKEEI